MLDRLGADEDPTDTACSNNNELDRGGIRDLVEILEKVRLHSVTSIPTY